MDKWHKPQNLDNYSQCVRYRGKFLYIYCIECDEWKKAQIQVHGLMYLNQSGTLVDKEVDEYCFVCQTCKANIEYLLNAIDKEYLKQKCL